MNQQDFTKIIMNPVRQRIVQYLILHEEGTVSSIREELNDIPPADKAGGYQFEASKTYKLADFEKNTRAWEKTIDWIIAVSYTHLVNIWTVC